MSGRARRCAIPGASGAAAPLALVLAAVGCYHDESWLQYRWDDRAVLCSDNIDDLTHDAPWDVIETQLALARNRGTVALLHAHTPGLSVSLAALDRVLALADRHGLDYVSYRELDAGQPARGALALSFDDNAIDAWYSIRDRLTARAARVTFFVTWFEGLSAADRARLAELAAEGHAVEAHSRDHRHPVDYVRRHGLAAYIADEVVPSIAMLEDAGFPVSSYAFPFGASTPELEEAVLGHVARVRVGPRACPY